MTALIRQIYILIIRRSANISVRSRTDFGLAGNDAGRVVYSDWQAQKICVPVNISICN